MSRLASRKIGGGDLSRKPTGGILHTYPFTGKYRPHQTETRTSSKIRFLRSSYRERKDLQVSVSELAQFFWMAGACQTNVHRPLPSVVVVAESELRSGLDVELRACQWLFKTLPDDRRCYKACIGRPFDGYGDPAQHLSDSIETTTIDVVPLTVADYPEGIFDAAPLMRGAKVESC
jgi:hypothetical protein